MLSLSTHCEIKNHQGRNLCWKDKNLLDANCIKIILNFSIFIDLYGWCNKKTEKPANIKIFSILKKLKKIACPKKFFKIILSFLDFSVFLWTLSIFLFSFFHPQSTEIEEINHISHFRKAMLSFTLDI